MELINIILIIIVILFLNLIFFFVLHNKKKENEKIDLNIIRFYLENYLTEFNASRILELNTKVEIDNNSTTQMSPFLIFIIIIFTICPFCIFKIIEPSLEKNLNNIMIIAVILIIYIIFLFIILSFRPKTKIKKLILKENILEFNNNKNDKKTYQLDTCNIKYNLQTIHNEDFRKRHRYINIYINNEKFTSMSYNIYDFEIYIAFIIFVNLKKTHDTEKIRSMTNDDIEKLHQNCINVL